MVKISIVVPVYNTEKYLNRCLDSILNQSLKEIEVIIVNDGSPDNSTKIIEEYRLQDSRVKVINKKNGGLSSARNAGIEIANGEYIIHLDSDDWIEQNYFKDMYSRAEQDKLDIVVSDIIWDYDNGKLEYRENLLISNDAIINGTEYLNMFFKGNIFPAVWSKIYKTELYHKNKIFHPVGISLGEDLATTPLLASKAKRIGKINKSYVHYIQNMESITKVNPTKKIYELIEAFQILEKKLLNINQKKINNKKINSIGILVFDLNYNINDSFYKESLIYYCKIFKEGVSIECPSIKMKIYFTLLKIFPYLTILKFILNFNRFISKYK
ncbi:MAG: glycosyltransferase family 2 protein [Fusobacteriaceae bacterium]